VLADRDDWVHRDYEKVMRMLEGAAAERDALAARVQALDAEAERLRTAISLQETAIDAQRALVQAQDSAHAAQVRMLESENDRRRGWRWWLRLPLVRLGLLKS
jgi:hypothetical protein